MRVEHGPTLGQRGVGAFSRAFVGPLLFVTGPQRLQGADYGDDRSVSAATHDGIVEFTADFGEFGSVLQMRGHRVVDLFELADDGVGAVGSLSRQCRAGWFELQYRRAQIGDDNRLALQ